MDFFPLGVRLMKLRMIDLEKNDEIGSNNGYGYFLNCMLLLYLLLY